MGAVRYKNVERGNVVTYGRVMPLLEADPRWERYEGDPAADAAAADAPAPPSLPFAPFGELVAASGEADDLLAEED